MWNFLGAIFLAIAIDNAGGKIASAIEAKSKTGVTVTVEGCHGPR